MATLVIAAPQGGQRHTLGRSLQVGRSSECDLVLDDSSVSRRHAVIRLEQGVFTLTDEGSRYGTFVNGLQVTTATLRHKDKVKFGNILATFEDETQDAQALAPERTDPGTLKLKIATLEARLGELTLGVRKSQALLALHKAFARCTSPGMVLQGAGPFLVRATRADRCALLSVDRASKQLLTVFRHQLPEVPPSRRELLAGAYESQQLVQAQPGADLRLPLAAPLPGPDGRPEGMLYLELGPGRRLESDDAETLSAMCALIGTTLAQLDLEQKVRREEKLRADLSRYVSDQVAEALVTGRLNVNLGGEKRRVTVLFVDVRGFTSLSEKLPPEQILQLLNEYFGQVVPLVKEAQGTVDKFIGDAMMAVFGAPNPLPDQELRAIRAATLIQAKVAALRGEWTHRPWAGALDVSKFAVGVGVNTGLAVAGNLGTDERREFAVIGDAVNVASRLCSHAKPGEIIIGPETAQAVSAQVPLRPLGPITVKGKAQPISAFAVEG